MDDAWRARRMSSVGSVPVPTSSVARPTMPLSWHARTSSMNVISVGKMLSMDCIASSQGLTLARFTAQLEDLRDTSLTSELNLSTFEPHPMVNLGCMVPK